MHEEVQRVVDAVEAMRAIEDEVERAKAITDLLRVQGEAEPSLREDRRQTVLRMRADKVPFRKIAATLGVSVGTVQDIVRGHSGPWGSRPRKAAGEKGSSGKPEGTDGT
ncbi:helix-turn-helix domain-containing protein [Streptomyces griseorubiginosus]|uniref:helix-turn-helix domain-containing protein n=1 Tax=Streptomyces griseorubiginosus TaxID=67304 RepID=UPI0036406705